MLRVMINLTRSDVKMGEIGCICTTFDIKGAAKQHTELHN